MEFDYSMQYTLLSLFLMVSSLSAQEIQRGPENIVVFVNQSADFRCEVRGGVTEWKVNQKPENELSPDLRNNMKMTSVDNERGTVVSTLTITARADYNGTTVQCVTFGNFSRQSGSVTLTIQGPVAAPSNLRVAENSTSVTISWTAPFSLDVTGVEPDILYSVLIYNVTDKNNPTAILCTDCDNIITTSYTFTPDYSSPCHVYNFSVIPVNGAGQGESSDNVTGYPLKNRNPSISFIGPEFESLSVDTYEIHFNAEGDTESVCEYQFWSVSEQTIQPSISNTTISFELPVNSEYSIVAISQNPAGGTETKLNFTTFDVQSASAAIFTHGGIEVTMQFINDTIAKGSLLMLQCKNKSCEEYRAVLRPSTNTTVTSSINVPPAEYTAVFFHDLEENGLPNVSPAFKQRRTVVVEEAESVLPNTESLVLKNAEIKYVNESAVHTYCWFKDGITNAACVVIYRANHDKDELTVLKYSQMMKFPVILKTADDPNNYTFVIFGKNRTHFDEVPFKFTSGSIKAKDDPPFILGILIGIFPLCALIVVVVLIVAVYYCYRKRQKSRESNNSPSNNNGGDRPPGDYSWFSEDTETDGMFNHTSDEIRLRRRPLRSSPHISGEESSDSSG